MAQVERLVPTNVGLLDVRNRSRRFSMHVGADVLEAFPPAEAQTKTKTNIFAYGYEVGERVSVGASLKGRVWSYQVAQSLHEWKEWCDGVGSKVIDEGISLDEIMRNFIRPEPLETRPALVPLALDWPWEVIANLSEEVRIEYSGQSFPLIDVDLTILLRDRDGPIPFALRTPAWSLEYRLILGDAGMVFEPVAQDGRVLAGLHRVFSLRDYLAKHGLQILLEGDAEVVPPGFLLRPDREIAPFDPDRLQVLDWSTADLRVESQGDERRPDSIQAHAFQHLLTLDNWDLVVDDDGSGEIADLVAIRAEDNELRVHLVHCKYAQEGKPGARVEDLYEVCGQAIRSARWRRNVVSMLDNLRRREGNRQKDGRNRILVGDVATLYRLLEQAPLLRPVVSIAIAQPGLAKSRVSTNQLELLASTETYLYEVAHSSLDVYCSEG
jgi:hypothetical protein